MQWSNSNAIAIAAMRKYTNAAATHCNGSGARNCSRGTDAIATAKLCTASGQLCHANQRSGKQRGAINCRHSNTCSQLVAKAQAQPCRKCKLHDRDSSKCRWAACRRAREAAARTEQQQQQQHARTEQPEASSTTAGASSRQRAGRHARTILGQRCLSNASPV